MLRGALVQTRLANATRSPCKYVPTAVVIASLSTTYLLAVFHVLHIDRWVIRKQYDTGSIILMLIVPGSKYVPGTGLFLSTYW